LIYIFEKLKKLEIPLNSLIEMQKEDNNKSIKSEENPYLNGKKGHLIYLFPLFTKCITTKENEVKVILKEIFEEVSNVMDLERFYE